MSSVPSDWRRYVRPEDLVWLVLFSALATISPERSPIVLILLGALGLIQVLESRIRVIPSIAMKLVLCFLLIHYSDPDAGGVQSSFYFILLLPAITAATTLGLVGTVVVSLLSCAVYLSTLLFLDWEHQIIPPREWRELILRSLIFPVVAYLTYQLAASNRAEVRKSQAAAEQLAEVNQSLREAEAQVRRAERLAALGQLTAGLAHELRNPLGAMKSSAELLSRQVGQENAIAKEMASYITAEVDRTNSLITRFLDFARPQHLKLAQTDLSALLDDVIGRFEREPVNGATIYKNYSPDIPSLQLDSELMERVFLNLLTNAAQASPPGGAITVKTRRVDSMVEASVIDRGSGIDPKNIENIFNPFFTTKPEGVGLGLAICSKIVDEHGGHIMVESSPGDGSVFRVCLPLK